IFSRDWSSDVCSSDLPVRGGRIKLAGIGIRETAHVACELDARRLHAQADTEIGNLFFASIADRNQHPLNTALAKAPRNQQAIVRSEERRAGKECVHRR